MKDTHLHELSLILLGVALTKTDRQRIVDALPAGSLGNEVDDLIDDVRRKRSASLSCWMAQRGVQVGKDVIDGILAAVTRERGEREIRAIVSELNYSRLEDVSALKQRLADCLARLEAI